MIDIRQQYLHKILHHITTAHNLAERMPEKLECVCSQGGIEVLHTVPDG